MSLAQMNAPRRSFVSFRPYRVQGALLAVVGAGALLSGCLTDPQGRAQIDPSSPIAADVAKLGRQNKDFPSFSEIPPMPTDVRPPRAFGRAVAELEQARAELEAATGPGAWTLSGSESFATTAQEAAGPELAAPDPGESEAFARELRRRATPPPPPKR